MKTGRARVVIQEDLPKEIKDWIIDNEEQVARKIEAEAKASTAFKDQTGKLRRSIRAVKSRYVEGGWIVKAGGRSAPHAHLVEFGHGGPQPAPAHSYLRSSKEKVIAEAIRMFGAK